MPKRYRLYRRPWGNYYCEDTQTKKHESLGTKNKTDAERLVHVKNEAARQPQLNREIGLAYLGASDPTTLTRTWQQVMDEVLARKTGPTQVRWRTAINNEAFNSIRKLTLVETRPEHFIAILKPGCQVSTNVYLRRLHNYCLDMRYLVGAVIVKRQWPKIVHGNRRGITLDEYQRIIAAEVNAERRNFYQVLWHTGGSQSDIATLLAEQIDWKNGTLSFDRQKLKGQKVTPPVLRIGTALDAILRQLPSKGYLFPSIAPLHESDRGSRFHRRCKLLGISGISLHSFRYAWAERAKESGYPERYAQAALGHTSRAVHRAYARNAEVELPSLEAWEEQMQRKVGSAEPSRARSGESAAIRAAEWQSAKKIGEHYSTVDVPLLKKETDPSRVHITLTGGHLAPTTATGVTFSQLIVPHGVSSE